MKKSRDKKLRILIVASPWLGGSGTVAWQLARGLTKMGHEVHFVTYNNPYCKENKNLKIKIHNVKPFCHSLFPFPLSEMSLAEKIIEVSVKYKINIIHSHYGTLFGHAAVLAMNYFDGRKRKPRLIITFHGTDVVGNNPNKPGTNITRYLQKTIIEKADAVTVVSGNLKSLIKKIYKTSRNIEVIRNGIKTPRIPLKNIDRLNQFIHISNFRKVKNIPTIIKSFNKFSKIHTDYTLKLIGTGPELKKIKSLVSRYKLNNKISFLGVLNRDQINKILYKSRALLLPSLYESSPLVILESFSTATPAIASKVGGIPELTYHNKDGILVTDPKNVLEFTEAMQQMIKSESRYKNMSQNALIKSSLYSIDKIVNQYIKLYRFT